VEGSRLGSLYGGLLLVNGYFKFFISIIFPRSNCVHREQCKNDFEEFTRRSKEAAMLVWNVATYLGLQPRCILHYHVHRPPPYHEKSIGAQVGPEQVRPPAMLLAEGRFAKVLKLHNAPLEQILACLGAEAVESHLVHRGNAAPSISPGDVARLDSIIARHATMTKQVAEYREKQGVSSQQALKEQVMLKEKTAPLGDPTSSPCCYKCRKVLENAKRCGACRIALYCGRECQQQHWPQHKVYCVPETSGQTAATDKKG
jgi:hypothetical protein